MRFAIGFALNACLIHSIPQSLLSKKNCNAFFGAAGGRFYVSNCKSNKSPTQNAFSGRPLFDLHCVQEPYTKRIVTLFLKQQKGGVLS